MNMRSQLCFTIAFLLLSGCLLTRGQVRNDTETRVRAQEQQKAVADKAAEADEREEQFRQLMGRVEFLENELKRSRENEVLLQENKNRQSVDQEKRLQAYEEHIKKLEEQLTQTNAEMAGIKAAAAAKKEEPKPTAAAGATKTEAQSGPYTSAEADFSAKRWKEAISGYQKYRENNPKGRRYPMATYKMGVCFQELGMKDEARVFYQEVMDKFPQDHTAQKAKYRLSTLK